MRTLLFILLSLLCSNGFSQITYSLKIKDTKGRPLRNVTVTAENKPAHVILNVNTNASGIAVFTLTTPGTYTFSYLDVKNFDTKEVLEGYSGSSSRTTTYDPKGVFEEKPAASRVGILFRTFSPVQLKGQANTGKVTVLVKNIDKEAVPGIKITVVAIQAGMKFEGRSNARGEVIFYLPIGQNYEIDAGEFESFKRFSLPSMPGVEKIETVFYEPLNITETTNNDTISQRNIRHETGTSTHVKFTLQINDYQGKPIAEEPVYAAAVNSPRVYAGETDENGTCIFMLEKGEDYVFNLKHESGIHLLEAPVSKGFRTASCARAYRGSKNIEAIIAQQEAEMNALKEHLAEDAIRPGEGQEITYNETPVEPIEAPVEYLTQTTDGFNINFSNQGMIGTPTLVGDKLFTQEGWYSPNYYCLDAKTGAFIWGVQLGEGGISPAVYHNGIILINTASCTLYAIDAATGKLLWSKWLSSYLYTTPSADDESVYVVYRHGGQPVAVSFDLKTGALNWMHRVDEDVIGSPVVYEDQLHITSQSGYYYLFDKKTGDLSTFKTDYKMVSSPTITEENSYVTAGDQGAEYLLVLDRKTLELKRKYPNVLNALSISQERNADIPYQMNFNGSHPIVYQNKYVVVTDADRIMTFDIASERLLWQQPIELTEEQLPIIANDQIILWTKTGLMSYDITTGKPSIIQKTTGTPEGQPIARNGLLYLSAGGILAVIRTLKTHTWGQWNKNAEHNLYWK